MNLIRVLIAAALMIWSPLSGAVAASLGESLSHHHCNNVWHDHATQLGDVGASIVPASENCDSGALNIDPWSCDDCQVALAALPETPISVARVPPPRFHLTSVAVAQAHVVFSHFRPPKA